MSASLNLARRAVACKRWRWMPGMRDAARGRVVKVVDIEDMHDGRERTLVMLVPERGDGEHQRVGPPRAVRSAYVEQLEAPDLDDPATLGCLLALVREAWGEPGMRPEKHDGIWIICDGERWEWFETSCELISGPNGTAFFSEAEALVAALEAAP